MKPVVRLWMLLLALLFSALPRLSSADEPASPVDAPFVAEPNTIRIPPVPPTFQTRDLGWMRISYAPSSHERVRPLIVHADEMKEKLADELGGDILKQVEVRIARTPEEMAALAPLELPPPPYATGVAYPALHLILLSMTAPGTAEAPDLLEVLHHELSHVALEDAVQGQHTPRWFTEGLAVYESGESHLVRLKTLWNATLAKTVIPLADLDRNFPKDDVEVSIAYAESADFVRFLLRTSDRARFASLIERVRGGEPFDHALAAAYRTDLRKLEFEWREEIAKRYTFVPVLTGGSFLWVLVIGAMGFGYVKKRRRAKLVLARWEREEAAAAQEASVIVPAERAGEAPVAVLVRNPAELPRVEHDGNWHTLH